MPKAVGDAIHLDMTPVRARQAGIKHPQFSYREAGDAYEVQCSRELAIGFLEGLRLIVAIGANPPELKLACAPVIARITELLDARANAAEN